MRPQDREAREAVAALPERLLKELNFMELLNLRTKHEKAGDLVLASNVKLIEKLSDMGLEPEDICKILIYHGITAYASVVGQGENE